MIQAEENAVRKTLEDVEKNRAVEEGKKTLKQAAGEIIGTEILKRIL